MASSPTMTGNKNAGIKVLTRMLVTTVTGTTSGKEATYRKGRDTKRYWTIG